MRFVAYGASYSHGVQSELGEPTATGYRVTRRGLEAQFSTRGIKDHEIELAAKTLHVHGLPEDSIEGGPVSPRSRISVFDTEQAQRHFDWTDDERELVEKRLLESEMYGLELVKVDDPKRPAPWKGYDSLEDVERILAAVEATGVDVSEVIAYERENEDREEVIAALTELLPEEEQSVVIDAT